MGNYKIFETDQFIKDLRLDFEGRPEKIRTKINSFVYPQIRANSFYGKNIKKLRNYTPETWRYRIGKYRFFYEIDEEEHLVYMIAADTRKDSY